MLRVGRLHCSLHSSTYLSKSWPLSWHVRGQGPSVHSMVPKVSRLGSVPCAYLGRDTPRWIPHVLVCTDHQASCTDQSITLARNTARYGSVLGNGCGQMARNRKSFRPAHDLLYDFECKKIMTIFTSKIAIDCSIWASSTYFFSTLHLNVL